MGHCLQFVISGLLASRTLYGSAIGFLDRRTIGIALNEQIGPLSEARGPEMRQLLIVDSLRNQRYGPIGRALIGEYFDLVELQETQHTEQTSRILKADCFV